MTDPQHALIWGHRVTKCAASMGLLVIMIV